MASMVCGILPELVSRDDENNLIIGIGVNVNNKVFNDSIKDKATSLFLEGINTTVLDIVVKILEKIEINYYTFLQYGFDFYINDYKKYCVNMNKDVVVINGNEKSYGKIININSDGTLLFEEENGDTRPLCSNEVRIRGINGYI